MRSKPGPVGMCRLRLVEAELQAAQGRWTDAADLARSAMSLASETSSSSSSTVQEDVRSSAEIELAASLLGTRALLVAGRDADAFLMAQQSLEIGRTSFAHGLSEDKRWQAQVLSTSLAGLVQHASCELDSASDSFDGVRGLLGDEDNPRTSLDYLIPEALKQIASFSSAQGKKQLAVDLGLRSIAAAEQRLEVAGNGLDLMLSPRAAEEIVADAKLLMGQSCKWRNAWDEAEEHLNAAIEVIETLGSKATLAMGLLPLAEVYSRTSRVIAAEGLYREIAKLLDLDPRAGKDGGPYVHSSVNSLVAWRFAQLLTVLPKRETEAAAWKQLAGEAYEEAPLKRLTDPEIMFGSLDRLSGKGTSGQGVMLDLMTRRCLPKFDNV
jgi:tetratricopeptide (TPR) repeat protein